MSKKDIVVHITGVSQLVKPDFSSSKSSFSWEKYWNNDEDFQTWKQYQSDVAAQKIKDEQFAEKAGNWMGSKINSSIFSVLGTSLEMGWNRYTTLQEDYLGEMRVGNVKASINTVHSLIQSTGNGAMTGASVGGPLGAAVGAVVGFGTSAYKQYMQNQQKLSNYYQQLNQTNFQTYLDSSRAGLVNNGRGTEN